jgi:hypothetical protein
VDLNDVLDYGFGLYLFQPARLGWLEKRKDGQRKRGKYYG